MTHRKTDRRQNMQLKNYVLDICQINKMVRACRLTLADLFESIQSGIEIAKFRTGCHYNQA